MKSCGSDNSCGKSIRSDTIYHRADGPVRGPDRLPPTSCRSGVWCNDTISSHGTSQVAWKSRDAGLTPAMSFDQVFVNSLAIYCGALC